MIEKFEKIVSYHINEAQTELCFSLYSYEGFRWLSTNKITLKNEKIPKEFTNLVKETFKDSTWVTYNKQITPTPGLVDFFGSRPRNWINIFHKVSMQTGKFVEYSITDQYNEEEIKSLCDYFNIQTEQFEISKAIMEVFFSYIVSKNFMDMLKYSQRNLNETDGEGEVVNCVQSVPIENCWYIQRYDVQRDSLVEGYLLESTKLNDDIPNGYMVCFDENTLSMLKNKIGNVAIVNLFSIAEMTISWYFLDISLPIISKEEEERFSKFKWRDEFKNIKKENLNKNKLLERSGMMHDFIRTLTLGFSKYEISGMKNLLKVYDFSRECLEGFSKMQPNTSNFFLLISNEKKTLGIFGRYIKHSIKYERDSKIELFLQFKYNRDDITSRKEFDKIYSEKFIFSNNDRFLLFNDLNQYPN